MTRLSSLPNKFFTAIIIIALVLVAQPAIPASAASITVNTTVDENANNASCSLREAIIAANNNATYNGCTYTGLGPDDVITLTSGSTYMLSIVGEDADEGDLDVGNALGTSGNLTIQANGATNAIIDANDINRVLEIDSPAPISLTLVNITITNGNSPDGAGIYAGGNHTLTLMNSTVSSNVATGANNCGAGIYDVDDGNISVINSTIADNTCTGTGADGGGIYKGGGGSLIIANSTFYNNTVTDNGGGIRILMTSGTAMITNSTFVNNVAGSKGGGIQVNAGTVTVEFSTFSGNAANTPNPSAGGAIQADGGSVSVLRSILANSTAGLDCDQLTPGTVSLTNSLVENNSDCTGTITSSSDPGFGALSDNDGSTQTMAITASSPAFNAASTCASTTTDQRGVARPQGSHCDLGSYELEQGSPLPTTPTFADVPMSHPYWDDIEILYANGLTAGCVTTPLKFCPDQIMDRAQSAVFMLRGNFGTSYTPPTVVTHLFADNWAPGLWAEKWAEGMYNANLTAGCTTSGPLKFCPWEQVPREQAVIFGLKLKYGKDYNPPAASGTVFADMTDTSYYATKWAEQGYADGLLPACGMSGGKPLFCPRELVSRGLAAYMIVRAKALTMP